MIVHNVKTIGTAVLLKQYLDTGNMDTDEWFNVDLGKCWDRNPGKRHWGRSISFLKKHLGKLSVTSWKMLEFEIWRISIKSTYQTANEWQFILFLIKWNLDISRLGKQKAVNETKCRDSGIWYILYSSFIKCSLDHQFLFQNLNQTLVIESPLSLKRLRYINMKLELDSPQELGKRLKCDNGT